MLGAAWGRLVAYLPSNNRRTRRIQGFSMRSSLAGKPSVKNVIDLPTECVYAWSF